MTKSQIALLRVCRIGYVEEAIQAEERLLTGDRQMWCIQCKRYHWGDECPEHDRLPQ